MSIFYNLISGKNVKATYFLGGFLREIVPYMGDGFEKIIEKARSRSDWEYIVDRVDYYCKKPVQSLGDDTIKVCDIRRKDAASTYYFDLKEYMRPFPRDTRINFLPGDITHIPSVPSLTKSRPIEGDNANSVLLKLDKIRHFLWVNDDLAYEDKDDRVIFRGKVPGKEKRVRFFEQYFGDKRVDLGCTSRHGRPEWRTGKLTLREQLQYKWILALEGNDVASNLKWVMSSNSVAVMPEPEYETWFMEGRLIPDVHYLRISRDFSDLHERLDYLLNNPEEAKRIVRNANEYTLQFRDEKRESIIATLVIARYLGYDI